MSHVDPQRRIGDLEKAAFEVIRQLSRTAEAASLVIAERGEQAPFLKIITHCSDRAEHVAQWFIDDDGCSEQTVIGALRDDLQWLERVLGDETIGARLNAVPRATPTAGSIRDLIAKLL
jgi:hypothetical protein